jgi:hypothetical protein
LMQWTLDFLLVFDFNEQILGQNRSTRHDSSNAFGTE